MPTALIVGASRLGPDRPGRRHAVVAIPDSVAGMRRVIADRVAHPGGGFFDWRGQPLPW
jgi:hypothetical protein